MKVVINSCYGGFSLSPLATKRLAELNKRKCYFFKHDLNEETYTPLSLDEAAEETFCVFAFDVKKPKGGSAFWKKHSLENRPENRSDPKLIQVVEELGDKANGMYAELRVIEIPDGIEYTIDEYDGFEHVAEAHQTWY